MYYITYHARPTVPSKTFISDAHRKEAHQFYESLGYKLDEVQGFKKYLG